MAEMEEIYRTDESGNPYSLDKSESGTNAFYFDDCTIVGRTAAYCVCMKRLSESKRGEISEMNSSCGDAINHNTCKAARMRREEVAAGHALYYVSRARINAKYETRQLELHEKIASLSNKKSSFNMPVARTVPKVEVETQDSALNIGGDYADAINIAMKETAPAELKKVLIKPEEPKPKSTMSIEKMTVLSPQKSGMSLIEMARARLAATAAA
jgi:hypothetical protein